MPVLRAHGKDGKYYRDKANEGNPKVNKGCPPLTTNHTSAGCMENSPGPSMQYIPLVFFQTGGFNDMISNGGIINSPCKVYHNNHVNMECEVLIDITSYVACVL